MKKKWIIILAVLGLLAVGAIVKMSMKGDKENITFQTT